MSNEKIIWRYGVQGYGIKKRCRKADYFSTDSKELGNGNAIPDYGVAVTLAKQWLRENVKQATKASATITRWTITERGSEQWEPMTESHNIKIPLTMNQQGE